MIYSRNDMAKNIEVEVRGPLTKEQFENLSKLFSTEGRFIADKNREAICFPDPNTGSLVERCETDIRVRNTNGIPELIVKTGTWGAEDESRREYSLIGKPGKFHEMIEMLAVMGFKSGMAVVRQGKVYEYEGVEFSLVEVPGHSNFFEAEIMVALKDKDAALADIKKICKKLGLTIFSQQEFYDYINLLNVEANREYNFEKFSDKYFEENFGL